MAGNKTAIVPPALAPGGRVAVIAPSSPFDRALVLRGVEWLANRYRVQFDDGLFERQGYLAGSDERRLRELDRALEDPDVSAIAVARGGYGLHRIAHLANWAALRAAPKWLVGFSDATVLHAEAAACGVASLHAQNVAGLGRGDGELCERWCRALEDPLASQLFSGLESWVGGRARGPLIGGNLTVLFTSAASGRLRLPDGAILALEDVTEQAYRIDRMVTALTVGGALDRVAGIALGDFTDCPSSNGVSAFEALRERLGSLGLPLVAGLPFGHGERNEPLLLGVPATLDAEQGTLTVGAPL